MGGCLNCLGENERNNIGAFNDKGKWLVMKDYEKTQYYLVIEALKEHATSDNYNFVF